MMTKEYTVRDALQEALAWGATYGALIPMKDWNEMCETMINQFTGRLPVFDPKTLERCAVIARGERTSMMTWEDIDAANAKIVASQMATNIARSIEALGKPADSAQK